MKQPIILKTFICFLFCVNYGNALAEKCSDAFPPAIAGEHLDHLNVPYHHYENHFPKFEKSETIFEDSRGKKIEIGPKPDTYEPNESGESSN